MPIPEVTVSHSFSAEDSFVWVHKDFDGVFDGQVVRLYAGESYYCGSFAIPSVLKALRSLFEEDEDSISGDTATLFRPHQKIVEVCAKNEFGKRLRGRPRKVWVEI